MKVTKAGQGATISRSPCPESQRENVNCCLDEDQVGGVCSWLRSSPDSLCECQTAGMNRRAATVKFFLKRIFDFCDVFLNRGNRYRHQRAVQMNMDLPRLSCSHRYCKMAIQTSSCSSFSFSMWASMTLMW